MRLKSSLRPISSSLRRPPVAGAVTGRRWISRPAATLVVGGQHQPGVELLGLQHVVLEHLRDRLQRLAPSPCSGTTP